MGEDKICDIIGGKMDSKKWFESKTINANTIVGILAVLALFLPGGELSSYLTPEVLKWVILVNALLNVVLRKWFTSVPVE